MAAESSQAEMDLYCPVCQEIFIDPVVLSCSHNFCKVCLQTWWAEKLIHQCPVCKRKSSKPDPPCNLVLKNLCKVTLKELSLKEQDPAGSEALCSLHSERLKLFCLDHQQPVCLVCRDSKTHNNHKFRPIDETVLDHKRKLETQLRLLKTKLDCFNQVTSDYYNTVREITVQAQQTERLIKEQFKKLHQFLEKEEEARISALKEEEEQKSQMMKERINVLNREIAALSDTVRATEEELRTEDVTFLKNYKAAVEGIRRCLLMKDPQLPSGALICQAKHLGNLTYNTWNKMKEMVVYFPVILDPNTAEPHLCLSEDLTTVRNGENKQMLPKIPERFENLFAVLGSEGFDSGTHSWDVEVVNDTDWAVGVIGESVPRKKEIQTGYWGIWFHEGKYKAFSPPVTKKVLSVKKPPKKIRVHLNCNKRKVTFSDPDTNTNMHTFSLTSSEKLFPYINTLNTSPLRISPVKVTAQLEM